MIKFLTNARTPANLATKGLRFTDKSGWLNAQNTQDLHSVRRINGNGDAV